MIQEKITLNSIGGYEYQKREAKKVIDFFNHYDKYLSNGAKLPRGIFFYGQPGNGKTMFAHAIVNEAKVKCYFLNEAQYEADADTLPIEMRNKFKEALENAPSILIIDEIDQLVDCSRRVYGRNTSDRQRDALRLLLTEIDQLHDSGVLVIATANTDIGQVPDALVRNGRIEKHIQINSPDFSDRKSILEIYLRKNKIFDHIRSEDIARITNGLACSSLVSLVNEVLIKCIASEKKHATNDDFNEPLQVIISGGTQVKSPKNNDDVIYHEIGHLVVDYAINGKVGFISTESYGSSEGRYSPLNDLDDTEDIELKTYQQIRNHSTVCIAGLVATEVFLGEKYRGASSDLKKIKENFDTIINHGLGDMDLLSSQLANSDTLTPLHIKEDSLHVKKLKEFIETIYGDAKQIIVTNRTLIEALFVVLKDKKALSLEEVKQIITNQTNLKAALTDVSCG